MTRKTTKKTGAANKVTKSATNKTTTKKPAPAKQTAAKKTTTKEQTVKKTAVKKAVKKTPTTSRAKKPAVKAVTKKISKPQNSKFIVSRNQRHQMISEAAYYLSLKSEHTYSCSTENWFEAEKMIDTIYQCKAD